MSNISVGFKGSLWAVIMAGGSGTRFWPVSRQSRPKQLTRILGETTMIQATVARLQPTIPAERVLVITTEQLAAATREQLPQLPSDHIIAEPVGRDTAPCVALAAKIVAERDPDATMVLLPADQVISPAKLFQQHLQVGAQAAANGALVTYGIEPRFAATGYGYVEIDMATTHDQSIQVNQVVSFKEKPDQATAEQYLQSGHYLWNAGIFTWRVDTVLSALEQHCPALMEPLARLDGHFGTPAFDDILAEVYPTLTRISIDYALMEHADHIAVVRCSFDWDDVGCWDSLIDHLPATDQGLRLEGQVMSEDCENCVLFNDGGPMIAAVGLRDHIVVSTADAVLVIPQGASQEVKQLVNRLADEAPSLK